MLAIILGEAVECLVCDSKKNSDCEYNYNNANCVSETKQCYIWANGDHIKHGCVGDNFIPAAINCTTNYAYCKLYSGNKQETSQKCLVCNDTNCATLSDEKQFTQCNGECFTYIDRDTVQRGCFQEMCNELKKKCTKSIENNRCILCKGSECNNEIVEDKCIECSKTDCRFHPESFPSVFCTVKSNFTGCFRNENKSNYEIGRGCFNDLSSNEKMVCNTSSNMCQPCFSYECNRQLGFQAECKYCYGNETTDCETTKGTDIMCPNYSSSCLVGIDEFGFTQRTCSSDKKQDAIRYSRGYELCYKPYCNKEPYPKQRLHCYQCSGEESCDYALTNEEKEGHLRPCKLYQEDDECYTVYDNGIFNLISFKN